jgi:predicted small secreted protein
VNRTVVSAAVVLGTAALAAGCSTSSGSGQQMADGSRSCGTTRTGVNVPVIIEVATGSVSCSTAMRIEKAYATDIRNGDVRGNGGGAPLPVDGWTCQGYPTPEVLRTGDASQCHDGAAKILAVLDVPAPSASSSG